MNQNEMENQEREVTKVKIKIMACFLLVFIPMILIIGAAIYFINAPETQKPPQITEGEFPFVVEYEMNGERYIIEDTVVCSFTGYDYSALWLTKPRIWNDRLKSGDEDKTIILHEENSYSVLEPKRLNEQSRVVLNYGRAAYYMGDKVNSRSLIYAKPFFYYSEKFKADENTTYHTGEKLSEKELEEYFGIKIIQFEFSKPIRNTFQ